MPFPGILAGLAGLGGLAGGLFGRRRMERTQEREQYQRLTPQQQAAQQQVTTMALGGLQGLQAPVEHPFDFGPIAQQARTQFREQTIPTIAERFTELGGQRGGAFRQSLSQAGAGLEESLAALQSKLALQQQELEQRMKLGQAGIYSGLLGAGLQPPFESHYFPIQQRPPGAFAQGLGMLGSQSPLLRGLF